MISTVVVIAVGLLIVPDTATATRWRLERRAEQWQPKSFAVLADRAILSPQVDLSGTWSCRHRRDDTTFTFSPRRDGRFEVDFTTGGCLGSCRLERIATVDQGVIRLDRAVAEYLPRTYDRLYAIRLDGTDYLLPEPSVPEFERERAAGSVQWLGLVLRRVENAPAPSSAPTSAGGAPAVS